MASYKNTFSVLPIYDDLKYQHHNKWYAYGKDFAVYCQPYRLPTFQFFRDHLASTPISSVIITRVETDGTFDITSAMNSNGLSIEEFSGNGYDVIKYDGNADIASGDTGYQYKGRYFVTISDGTNTWYSDYFNVMDLERLESDRFTKIEYWNDNGLNVPNGHLSYNNSFKHRLYLHTSIGKPNYEFSENVQTRDGVVYPIYQTSKKFFRFSFITNTEQYDALRIIRLHDNVTVVYNDITYDANNFIPSNPDFFKNGDLANVNVSFETDTIVNSPSVFIDNNTDDEGVSIVDDDFVEIE